MSAHRKRVFHRIYVLLTRFIPRFSHIFKKKLRVVKKNEYSPLLAISSYD